MSTLSRPPFPASPDEAPVGIDPTPREIRAQMVQRLQVGLFGLSLMLLLVGLANIIMDHARRNDAAMAQSAPVSSSSGNGSSDPLADIGVVPSPDAMSGRRANGQRAGTSAGR